MKYINTFLKGNNKKHFVKTFDSRDIITYSI